LLPAVGTERRYIPRYDSCPSVNQESGLYNIELLRVAPQPGVAMHHRIMNLLRNSKDFSDVVAC